MEPRTARLTRAIWDLYFDRTVDEYANGSALLELIDEAVTWLGGAGAPPCLAGVNWRRDRVITIPWAELRSRLPPSLAPLLQAFPTEAAAVHSIFGAALCTVRALRLADEAHTAQYGLGSAGGDPLATHLAAVLYKAQTNGAYAVAGKHDRMVARFACVTPVSTLQEISARSVGTWISLRGTVLNMGKVRARVQRLPFVCTREWWMALPWMRDRGRAPLPRGRHFHAKPRKQHSATQFTPILAPICSVQHAVARAVAPAGQVGAAAQVRQERLPVRPSA